MSDEKESKGRATRVLPPRNPFYKQGYYKTSVPDLKRRLSERSKEVWERGAVVIQWDKDDTGRWKRYVVGQQYVGEEFLKTNPVTGEQYIAVELVPSYNADDGRPRLDKNKQPFVYENERGEKITYHVVSPYPAGVSGVGWVHMQAAKKLGLTDERDRPSQPIHGFSVIKQKNGMKMADRSYWCNASVPEEKRVGSVELTELYTLTHWYEAIHEEHSEFTLIFKKRRSLPPGITLPLYDFLQGQSRLYCPTYCCAGTVSNLRQNDFRR